MRLFFTNILLRLLGIPRGKVNEGRILKWFWTSYPQQGFKDYIMKRDMALLQQMGNGVDREQYLALLGQRIELGLLITQAKRSYQKVEDQREEKIRMIKKTSKNNIKE
jgi:hypothetical protein